MEDREFEEFQTLLGTAEEQGWHWVECLNELKIGEQLWWVCRFCGKKVPHPSMRKEECPKRRQG